MSQAQFDYRSYPVDKQTVEIRFESYSLPETVLQIDFFTTDPVQLYGRPGISPFTINSLYSFTISIYDIHSLNPLTTSGQKENFKNNPLWTYKSYVASIGHQNNAITGTPRYFSQGIIELSISRISSGILMRLVLPILMVGIMTGVLFWARKEDRSEHMHYIL